MVAHSDVFAISPCILQSLKRQTAAAENKHIPMYIYKGLPRGGANERRGGGTRVWVRRDNPPSPFQILDEAVISDPDQVNGHICQEELNHPP